MKALSDSLDAKQRSADWAQVVASGAGPTVVHADAYGDARSRSKLYSSSCA